MSKSPKLGTPRCFVIFDPETGRVIKGMRVPPFRLKQQMAAYPGMKVMRVDSLKNIPGSRVEDGVFIPGPEPKPFDPLALPENR